MYILTFSIFFYFQFSSLSTGSSIALMSPGTSTRVHIRFLQHSLNGACHCSASANEEMGKLQVLCQWERISYLKSCFHLWLILSGGYTGKMMSKNEMAWILGEAWRSNTHVEGFFTWINFVSSLILDVSLQKPPPRETIATLRQNLYS